MNGKWIPNENWESEIIQPKNLNLEDLYEKILNKKLYNVFELRKQAEENTPLPSALT